MVNIEAWNKERKRKGITLDDLAKQTDISISTIKDIFRGKTDNPRIDTVQAIERVLGIQPHWTDEEIAEGVGNHPVNLSPEEWEVIELFSEIKRVKGDTYCRVVIDLLPGLSTPFCHFFLRFW